MTTASTSGSMKLLSFVMLFALPASSLAANKVNINYDTVGCIEADNLSRSIELGQSGDQEAYVNFLQPLIEGGECAMLKEGQSVFMEDVSLMSGTACVRPRGETKCFTVEYEAIQGKSNTAVKPPVENKDESLLHKLLK